MELGDRGARRLPAGGFQRPSGSLTPERVVERGQGAGLVLSGRAWASHGAWTRVRGEPGEQGWGWWCRTKGIHSQNLIALTGWARYECEPVSPLPQCVSQTTVPVCHRQHTPKKWGSSLSGSRETGSASPTQVSPLGLGYLGWALRGPSGRRWGWSCVEPEEESRSGPVMQASNGFQSTRSWRDLQKGMNKSKVVFATELFADTLFFERPRFCWEIFWGCRSQSKLKITGYGHSPCSWAHQISAPFSQTLN